jgi:hypothetical protein
MVPKTELIHPSDLCSSVIERVDSRRGREDGSHATLPFYFAASSLLSRSLGSAAWPYLSSLHRGTLSTHSMKPPPEVACEQTLRLTHLGTLLGLTGTAPGRHLTFETLPSWVCTVVIHKRVSSGKRRNAMQSRLRFLKGPRP